MFNILIRPNMMKCTECTSLYYLKHFGREEPYRKINYKCIIIMYYWSILQVTFNNILYAEWLSTGVPWTLSLSNKNIFFHHFDDEKLRLRSINYSSSFVMKYRWILWIDKTTFSKCTAFNSMTLHCGECFTSCYLNILFCFFIF